MKSNLYYDDAINACLAYAGASFAPTSLLYTNPKLYKIQQEAHSFLTNNKKPTLKIAYQVWLGLPCGYENGWYRCHNATAYVSKNNNILTVAFRGTDHITELKDYMALYNHYKYFKPLAQAVIKYAKKNNLEIRAVGHSLGGAMVEYFIEENQHEELKMRGTTFGSPGSSAKNISSKIKNFYHLDDAVPYIGKILYKKHGHHILIKKPKLHPLSSHLSEEYVCSIEEIPTEGVKTDLEYQEVDVKSRLFKDYSSEKLDSVHLTYNFKIPNLLKKVIKKFSIFNRN